jgi:hypothetical protein
MRMLSTFIVGATASMLFAGTVLAQPRPYDQRGARGDYSQQQRQQQRTSRNRAPIQGDRSGGQYYYNGRWVDSAEWQRHSSERQRWAQNYQYRRGHRGGDNSSALVAGIVGFALGAAIVGSQQQAERARTADANFDEACARRYRSYDRGSRTYMGYDGVRHYCQ